MIASIESTAQLVYDMTFSDLRRLTSSQPGRLEESPRRGDALGRQKRMRPEIKWPRLRTVLVVAALLRLASVVVVRSFLHPQTWEFGLLAENLVKGLGYSDLMWNGTYQPSIYMPPAYPFFLAFFYRIGGERPVTFLVIELIQAGLGVLLVYLIYRLALILVGEPKAIVAACLTAIYPTQVYMANEFHPINIYIVLEVATVFFLVRSLEISASSKDLIRRACAQAS